MLKKSKYQTLEFCRILGIDFVREGDTIVVYSMDRLAHNLVDVRFLVQKETQRGKHIEFVKETLNFTGKHSPVANLRLSVMGAFVKFEPSLIKERQMEGITLAKKRGVYKGHKAVLSKE